MTLHNLNNQNEGLWKRRYNGASAASYLSTFYGLSFRAFLGGFAQQEEAGRDPLSEAENHTDRCMPPAVKFVRFLNVAEVARLWPAWGKTKLWRVGLRVRLGRHQYKQIIMNHPKCWWAARRRT